MKKILLALWCLVTPMALSAQTDLTQGDIAFIGFNTIPSSGAQWIAVVATAPIFPGTQFYLTNRKWGKEVVNKDENNPLNYEAFDDLASGEGTYRITIDEFLSVGQVIKITISGTPTTSVGSIEVLEGSTLNLQNKSVMWIYQDDSDANSLPDFVSCFYWNDTDMLETYGTSNGNFSPPYYYNTGLDMVSANSSKTGITTFYGSNNDKCGRFDPVTYKNVRGSGIDTLVNYSDPLGQSLYYGQSLSDIVWLFSGTCNTSGGVGDLDVARNWLSDVDNIVFDQYMYTCTPPSGFTGSDVPGWFGKKQSEASWSKVTGSLDFTNTTFDKEIIIDCDVTIPNGTDFRVSRLSISANTTLTFEPNTSIAIYFDSDNQGTIKLLTELSDPANLGQTSNIIPTSASLGGTFVVEHAITETYGWHHMSSPIVTKLSDIVFEQLDLSAIGGGASTKTFALNDGASDPDFRNIYVWNPEGVVNGLNQLELWQPIPNDLNTDNFSDQAYTIYIPQECVPLKFTVTGPLLAPDSDFDVPTTIGYQDTLDKTPTPGFGAPWWSSTNSLKGWNFVRNPFMSYISVADFIEHYITPVEDGGNQVFNSVIYQYAPNYQNSINIESNYRMHNDQTGDTDADYIAPFAAFFVQTSNNGAFNPVNVPTLSIGKKCLNLEKNGKNPFWKTTPTNKLSLSVKKPGDEKAYSSVHVDPREDVHSLDYNGDRDALKVSNQNGVNLYLGHDSLNYGIKQVPSRFDSLSFNLGCGSPNHNETLQITNHEHFNTHFHSYLIDHKLNKVHYLNSGPYSFKNDPDYSGYRFTWKLYPSHVQIPVESTESMPWWHSLPDGIYVSFDKPFTRTVELLDLNGRTIKEVERNYEKHLKLTDFGELKPGVYLIKTQYGTLKMII
jgi:hypothetical protein